jgi:hypothetical protein
MCACPILYTFDMATGDCVSCPSCCQYGDYYNTADGMCEFCGTTFTGCIACTEPACSICSDGYYLNAPNCIDCTLTMPGCQSCTSSIICSTCDNTNNFEMTPSNNCSCANGYALSATSTCVPCSDTLPGCLTCSSQAACTSCDLGFNFITDPDNSSQCACNPGFYLSTDICTSCLTTGMVGCTECSSVTACTACDSSQDFNITGTSC